MGASQKTSMKKHPKVIVGPNFNEKRSSGKDTDGSEDTASTTHSDGEDGEPDDTEISSSPIGLIGEELHYSTLGEGGQNQLSNSCL